MENATISIATLQKLVEIADDYVKDDYGSELSKSYFIGKRDAYKNILDTFAN